jgi:aldehyde:ferredoxin oxidoreductase
MKNRELVIRDYLTGEPIGRDEVIEMLRRYYNARGWKKNGCP